MTLERSPDMKNPMVRTPESMHMVQQAQEIAHMLDFSVGHVLTGGASDASYTTGFGVPTLDGEQRCATHCVARGFDCNSIGIDCSRPCDSIRMALGAIRTRTRAIGPYCCSALCAYAIIIAGNMALVST